MKVGLSAGIKLEHICMFIFDIIRKQKFENGQKVIMFDKISRNAAR